MNRRNLPLNALRACEAAARHLSFSKAADELCVTHAAVSHQIKGLEAQLGVTLFRRSNRGVRLTEAGEALVPVLGEAFDRIAGTIDDLVAEPRDRALRVALTPLFASRWLMPRLGRLRAAHPGLEVGLLPNLRLADLTAGEADVAIRCGLPPWSGLHADFLLPVNLTPLCAPSALEGDPPLRTVADLLGHSLIHADIGEGRQGEEWKLWFAAAGLPRVTPSRGLSFRDPGLALQAAADGLGIAMGYAELTLPEIDAGRLVRPFDIVARHPFSYYLVHSEARRDEAGVAAFRQWILTEAATGGTAET